MLEEISPEGEISSGSSSHTATKERSPHECTPAEDRLLARRPPQVLAKLPANSRVCLLNSKDILRVLKAEPVIVMACNTRIKHVIPGIMRAAEELDAVVAFELARSECSLEGGYTGFTPKLYAETVIGYAQETHFTKPFFIHADHITVKSTAPEAIKSATGTH